MRSIQYAATIVIATFSLIACKKEQPDVTAPADKQETVYTIPKDYSFNKNSYPMKFDYRIGADTATSKETFVPVLLARINDKQLLLQISYKEVTINDTLTLDSMVINTTYKANGQPNVDYQLFAHHNDGDWKGVFRTKQSATVKQTYNFEYNLKKDNSDEYIFVRMYIPVG